MKNFLVLAFTILSFSVSGFAQNAATTHVFPQIADGLFADGTFYQSVLLATAVTDLSTTCQYRFFGVPTTRIFGSDTFTLQGSGSFAVVPTVGFLFPIATGYATLTCNQSVNAVVAYIYNNSAQTVLSGAAVFSSPKVTRSQLITNEGSGIRLAMAIANDSDTSNTYQVTAINEAGQTVASTAVTVAARSNLARFLNEIFTTGLPANFVGRVVVSASGGATFSMIGLNYFGPVFLTQPATVLP